MPSYPDHANPALLERLPLEAEVVLDIGCASGALGAEYKRRNPRARYLGIERNPEAAAIASGRLDGVAVIDIENEALPFDLAGVDCLVFGDVLEHLADPWSTLARTATLLSPGGTALICVPNVEHWSLVSRLLRGNFDYDEQGLFDRTHLRWFTWEMTRRAIAGAGLEARDAHPRIFDGEAAAAFVASLSPGLEALGVDPAEYRRRASPLQYVWRARRTPVPRLTVVSTMLAPVGGVSEVRVIEPMRGLSTDPDLRTIVANGFETDQLALEEPKVFVFHRPLLAGEAGLETVRGLIARDYVVVCEFDDHPDFIPVLQRPDIQNFRAVHAIQTSTEPLAAVLRRDNPEVAVFPNAIGCLPDVVNHADPERTTLFFGGLNREQDWPPYLDALNAVARFAGGRLFFRIVADRALFDALETEHKAFTPLCDYPTYLRLLSQSEISFMPLADTPFNRCKSDLKFIEAAAHGVAAVASPVAYAATIENARTGLLFSTPSELQQRLARLVADRDLCRTLGTEARAYVVRERMLAYQIAHRSAWYRGLWARRRELNEALLARVPELAAPVPVAP